MSTSSSVEEPNIGPVPPEKLERMFDIFQDVIYGWLNYRWDDEDDDGQGTSTH